MKRVPSKYLSKHRVRFYALPNHHRMSTADYLKLWCGMHPNFTQGTYRIGKNTVTA